MLESQQNPWVYGTKFPGLAPSKAAKFRLSFKRSKLTQLLMLKDIYEVSIGIFVWHLAMGQNPGTK